jgi:ankyrin repeat protein
MGEFCLLNAANSNNEYEANLLIQHNVNVNTTEASHNFAPLHFAAGRGNTNIGKMLLDKNALINVQDIYGNTPLHIAVEKEHIPFIELLLTHGADQTIRNNQRKIPMRVLLDSMHTYDKAERKRLSKIHGKLLTAHIHKAIKEHQ